MYGGEVGRCYAVGWGALALINAGLAGSKRRSRLPIIVVADPAPPRAS